jgi:hypothetical protein
MKKKLTIFLLIAIAAVATWYFEGIHGDGAIIAEDRTVPEFSGVTISGAFTVQWSRGKPGLSITTDRNLLPHISTVVSDGTLRISSEKSLRPTGGLTVTISGDSLADVHLSGANTFRAGQITGPELKVLVSGASTISLDGSVTKLDARLTGASTLHAQTLRTQTATVGITGACSAHVNVTDALKASITGAGSITYSGNPRKTEKSVTGVGSIHAQP